MRKKIAHFFLLASVITWGTWFGGQFFNWAMVIPKRLSNRPETIKAEALIPVEGGFPFFFISPLLFLFSLIAVLLGWKWARQSRKWLLLTCLLALSISLALIFYLAPLIHSTDYIAGRQSLPTDEIVRRVNEWKTGNVIRLLFDFIGFLLSVIALQTWWLEASTVPAVENNSEYSRQPISHVAFTAQ